jgi:hypothetical protein
MESLFVLHPGTADFTMYGAVSGFRVREIAQWIRSNHNMPESRNFRIRVDAS